MEARAVGGWKEGLMLDSRSPPSLAGARAHFVTCCCRMQRRRKAVTDGQETGNSYHPLMIGAEAKEKAQSWAALYFHFL